jgi:uncharacterized protein YjbI with pentapeptide repeats
MTTQFPTAPDTFTNPVAADLQSSVTVPHADQHANINDAMVAVQAKVGKDGDPNTASHDYKLSAITGTDKAVSTANFSGTSYGNNSGDQSLFSTVVVSGQSTITATGTTSALTLIGSGVTITTSTGTGSLLFSVATSTGGGGGDIAITGVVTGSGSSSITLTHVAPTGTGATVLQGTATLSGTTLVGSPLISGATMVSSTLSGALIFSSTLSGCAYIGGTISGSTIGAATIAGPTISGGTISGSTIGGATIIGMVASGGTWVGGSLSGATVNANTLTVLSASVFSGSVTFGKSVVSNIVTLTLSGTNLKTDASLGNAFGYTLTGSMTMSAPTNPTDGQIIRYRIRQSGAGSFTITWDSIFVFTTSQPTPVLSTALNKMDVVSFEYDSTNTKWPVVGYRIQD